MIYNTCTYTEQMNQFSKPRIIDLSYNLSSKPDNIGNRLIAPLPPSRSLIPALPLTLDIP
jgi:hypothetical protein